MINPGSRDQLLRYAAASQLERVRDVTGHTHARFCAALPRWKDPGNFERALRAPSYELLQHLDDRILALVPKLDYAGGLSALSVRLGRIGGLDVLTARLPPSWRREVLARPIGDDLDILAKASGLLAELRAAPDNAQQVADRHHNILDELVQRLILLGVSPPTPRNVDALLILGSIAGTGAAFEVVERHLEQALLSNPLNFRVWRALTSVVRVLDQDEERSTNLDVVSPWIQAQVAAAEELQRSSLFPARSLDIELCIAIPESWSSPKEDDWVNRALELRAANPEATLRERGTAAHGMWRRALRIGDRTYLEETERFLRALADQFEEEAQAGDDLSGLSWVAVTLRGNLDERVAVSSQWPRGGRPYIDLVLQALNELPVDSRAFPKPLQKDTRTLVEHSLLQNAGVIRRHSIDALAAGGWGHKLIPVYAKVINDERTETWLRCRALFALSFLQDRSRAMSTQLERSCKHAEARLTRSYSNGVEPTRGAIAEMHAALFAVGDVFGPAGSDPIVVQLRKNLDTMIDRSLAMSNKGDARLFPLGRAAAYVLAMILQSGDTSARDKFNEYKDTHRDATVQNLCNWALKRFDRSANVRPVYEIVFP
jgi:hypothetical protein